MAVSTPLLDKYFTLYQNYVSQNPQLTSDIETSVKWISYILSARIDDSSIWSELIYSLSNLLVLFNDRIIAKSRSTASTVNNADKLKIWLTVLEYSEVFIELSCYKVLGKRGKWAIILLTQILKENLDLIWENPRNFLHPCDSYFGLKLSSGDFHQIGRSTCIGIYLFLSTQYWMKKV